MTLWCSASSSSDSGEGESDSEDDEAVMEADALVLEGGCPTTTGFVDQLRIGSHQTCITSMFEPGTVTKYVPIRPLGPFFRVSPNQHITNRAYHYSI
ncbi:hypothetical protein HaLaN_25470 [Haematococcus lacustris]|uniref:Uncharacterized protein n=1 Tax=Haematococcus lacustris TaxID=44745 RepID=A0A6A0A067_HAELA|nr:hypothetical protein HaLaN_25470 [Haematococcus lacustris]